jgi:hypothetical protein
MRNSMRAAVRLGVVLTAVLGAIAGIVAPAQAASRVVVGSGNETPWVVFERLAASPHNSPLTMYFSIGGTKYSSRVRAGSGDGSTNDCLTNRGWLPGGTYNNIPHYRKTWGNTVVRGYVWELGSMACHNGSVTRTELFIHSNGIEGTTWNGSYATQGCIKISQVDRGDLSSWWRSAYNNASGDLYVLN